MSLKISSDFGTINGIDIINAVRWARDDAVRLGATKRSLLNFSLFPLGGNVEDLHWLRGTVENELAGYTGLVAMFCSGNDGVCSVSR